MSKSRFFVSAALIAAIRAVAQPGSDDLVLIEGGVFSHPKSNFASARVAVPSFYLGRHEVTQKQWTEVMGTNPSQFKGDDRPVEMVSWYDCIEYCNQRSRKEGLQPYYTIIRDRADPANESPDDSLKWTVTVNPGANGYRLPTEAEWEFAAGGGRASKHYAYAGGDDPDAVAWSWRNSGDKPLSGAWNWPAIEQNGNQTRPVGRKAPNELGLHDMSGNVREWCWDWYADTVNPEAHLAGSPRGAGRVWKGGGWLGAEFCGEPSFRTGFDPNSRGADQGFRVCRNAGLPSPQASSAVAQAEQTTAREPRE